MKVQKLKDSIRSLLFEHEQKKTQFTAAIRHSLEAEHVCCFVLANVVAWNHFFTGEINRTWQHDTIRAAQQKLENFFEKLRSRFCRNLEFDIFLKSIVDNNERRMKWKLENSLQWSPLLIEIVRWSFVRSFFFGDIENIFSSENCFIVCSEHHKNVRGFSVHMKWTEQRIFVKFSWWLFRAHHQTLNVYTLSSAHAE